VITESTATKYFGSEDPIGKSLEIRFSNQYRIFNVTTVVEDPPANSSIRFGIIVSDLNNKLLMRPAANKLVQCKCRILFLVERGG